MALNLKKVAQKSTVLAEIMENKTKGTTEELIAKNSPVTINDCEVMEITNESGERERVWAFTIKEEPNKFYFAGTVMRKIFEDALTECEGDYTELYSAVVDQNLTVRFKESKTKKGRPVTVVEVL